MSKKQNSTSTKLDQFYTSKKYAANFFDKLQNQIDLSQFDVQLEPSAGSGSFYNLLDQTKRVGLDLDPKAVGVIQQDFFDWLPPEKRIITIGNPPFGKNANLAVKFFNRAATFSDVIAFVLPRTFRKASIINRLNKHFHLLYDEEVPENSFVFDDKPYDVWCCAQIWIRKNEVRHNLPILNFSCVKDWFEIVTPDNADFAIQRVGGRAGLIRTKDFKEYSNQSHYFIKQHKPEVIDIFNRIDFKTVKFNTAGNPSISPSELIELWIDAAKTQNIFVSTTTNKKNLISGSVLFVEE